MILECLYGDRHPSCNAADSRFYDSPVLRECCQTWVIYVMNIYCMILECPYGDRNPSCNAPDCRFYNAAVLRECCQTCASFLTTTPQVPISTTTASSSKALPCE